MKAEVFWQHFFLFFKLLCFATCGVYAAAYKAMAYMAKATYSASGQLLDGGIDLNMEASVAE